MSGKELYKKLVEYTKSIDRLSSLGYWVTLHIVFSATLDCYSEATRCYDTGIIEASIIMCRNAIDSAIFEGVVKELTPSINYPTWSFKDKFGFEDDWWREWLATPQCRDEISLDAVNKIKKIAWKKLSCEGKKKGLILDSNEAIVISKLRDMGNYSAHRASGIMQDLALALKENRAVKVRHTEEQAKTILEETEMWLEKIINRYNAFYDKGQDIG